MLKSLVYSVYATFLFLLVGSIVVQTEKLSRSFSIKVHEAKASFDKMVGVQPVNLQEAIYQKSSLHNIDPLILEIIVKKESNNGNINSLYRFEPALFAKLKAHKAYKGYSDGELRMLASSHGPFHILGATGQSECGLHFSQLYDTDKATDCAARIVSRLSQENNGQVRMVFKGYNGSGPMADKYATDAMLVMAEMLYNKRSTQG